MGGQNLERRRVLEILSLAASAALFPGFSRWSFADPEGMLGGGGEGPAGAPPGSYEPQFFSASEYAAVGAVTERIIPSDDTPGAREAGVSEFIDFMVLSDATLQEPFREGLAWLGARAREVHGTEYVALREDQQDHILASIADAPSVRAADEPGVRFFELIRYYTVVGFYTSRVGMEHLDNPYLESYGQMPGCPHSDDPEHRHLVRGVEFDQR